MVDASAGIGDLVHRRADPFGQHFGSALDAVAQAGKLNARFLLHSAAHQHHRIGVVEHGRVGAIALHILGDVEHYRDRP
jgi:hypothetical protein